MQRVAVNVCRIVLAIVFILSGFVKAVDPLGTQYKIQDYLSAMHLGAWVPDFATLAASVLLSAVEFCLGICLLFAIRRRLTSRLVLAVMLVMLPLTLWLALTNPVSDCGCFGDAIVLTNWQTLWKNVVLLVCAIVVAWQPLMMFRFVSRSNQWIVTNYSVLFILMVSGWCLYDLPIFDFRPYHVGASIREGMKVPEGAEQPQFETTFIMEKDGETKTFTVDNYPDSTWTFVDSRTKQIKAGFVPPIHDFSILLLPPLSPTGTPQAEEQDEAEDITEEVLSNPGYTFLLVSPQLEQADDSRLDLINELYEYAQENDYPFYCLTASTESEMTRWQDMTGAEYPFCSVDGTTLKTIIRSNPGLLLLKDGVVINKWSHNRLPDEQQLDGRLEKLEIGRLPNDSVPGKILMLLMWFVLPLALLTIADRTWMWTKWLRRERKIKIEK
jgi:triosephosphate isomerase